ITLDPLCRPMARGLPTRGTARSANALRSTSGWFLPNGFSLRVPQSKVTRTMRLNAGKFILITACSAWVLTISIGIGVLWVYENASGQAAAPPAQWPVDSGIHLANDRATLIMLIHPHCPCSRASIGELARLMAQAQ